MGIGSRAGRGHPAGSRLLVRRLSLDAPVQFDPVHQRERPGTREDHERAVLAERICLRAQMPDQLACRGHHMHRVTAPGPAAQDLGAAERNAELPGLGQEDPARRFSQPGSLKWVAPLIRRGFVSEACEVDGAGGV
jgi:hypothetical protein